MGRHHKHHHRHHKKHHKKHKRKCSSSSSSSSSSSICNVERKIYVPGPPKAHSIRSVEEKINASISSTSSGGVYAFKDSDTTLWNWRPPCPFRDDLPYNGRRIIFTKKGKNLPFAY